MEVKAIHRNARISASKGRDLARAVQGKRLGDALRIVDFSPRKAAKILGAALRSGELGLTEEDLEGAVRKRVPGQFIELNRKALAWAGKHEK